ncbi:MAG TPA: hypothetical protein VH475_21675 [Tepidisphaeraceae bacterium]|jgi:hypothetical protein
MRNTDAVSGNAAQGAENSIEGDLASKIRQLQADRERHAQAIADIDHVLRDVEHALAAIRGEPVPQRPAPASMSSRRRYQKLPTTGEESVLAFVRQNRNPTTAQINAHWRNEGRPGVANPTLARLLKRGWLRREDDPRVRGSRYRVTESAAKHKS